METTTTVEMKRDGLNQLLEPQGAELIEHDGENNGDNEVDGQISQGQQQGVLQSVPEGGVAHELPEILKPNPLGAVGAHTGPVAPEGQDVAHHGSVLKYNEVKNGKYHH